MVERSCLTCPNYVAQSRTMDELALDVGAPVCRLRGIPLLTPRDLSNEAAKTIKLQVIAGSCTSYGKKSEFKTDFEKRAREQDNTIMKIGKPASKKSDPRKRSLLAEAPNGCFSCSQFVSPTEVFDKTSFINAGMCVARGGLLPRLDLNVIANNCDNELKSEVELTTEGRRKRATLDSFEFSARYGLASSATLAPIAVETAEKVMEPIVIQDPRTFETQAPVDDESRACGIRAWRKIFNPRRNTQFVYMAVYDNAFFSADELAKIPQIGDEEAPELYNDYSDSLYKVAVAWNELKETPAVWGEPGVGKTELFRHIAWLMQLPFERISVTATTEVDDLVGKMVFDPENGTHFRKGRLPLAWAKPSVICIDEPNVGPPEVWHVLRPLTDNSKQLILDASAGERIEKHDDCYLGLAMNPAWDIRNAGAESIADADSSRLMHIAIQLPDVTIEKGIIQARVQKDGWALEPSTLNQLMRIAADIRSLSNDGSLPISWGLRHQIKVARALKWFEPVDAYRIAAADFLEPDHRDKILDVVRTTMRATAGRAGR